MQTLLLSLLLASDPLATFELNQPVTAFELIQPLATFELTTTIPSKPDGCQCGIGCECGKGGGCDCVRDSDELRAEAIHTGKQLVVFVNQPVKPVNGALSCWSDEYRGSKEPGVVVLYPRDGQLWERTKFKGVPTPEEFTERTRPRMIQRVMPMSGGDCVGGS